MRAPPLLLGAALLFWGWQSGFLLVGALMAVLLEGSRVVHWRWELSEKDFRRIWDFCALLFVAAAVYAFTSNDAPTAVLGFFRDASPGTQSRAMEQAALATLVLFRWLPMLFFLAVAAQAFSARETLPWSVFSLWLRWRAARQPADSPSEERGVNTAYPYFAACLLAASITITPTIWYYTGLGLLLAWALWFQRPKRFAPGIWAALVLLALLLGFGAQIGFFTLTRWANIYGTAWLSQFMASGVDPRGSRTAIGSVGRVKLSGKIVLRVTPKDAESPPALLREASYRFFKHPDWAGAGRARDFDSVAFLSESNQTTWSLVAHPRPLGPVTIAQYLTGQGQVARRGLLAVPQGIVRLENLAAYTLTTNRLGVVRVDEGPGLVIYDAYFAPTSTIDAPPEREDLTIPVSEDTTLSQIAVQLNFNGQTTNQILRTISAFFRDNFHYSTWLPASHRGRTNLTPLANFLLHDRSGHCEYFGTAATLLLRKAGVPARYAVGYAVQEKSGHQFLVRQRHAHAWCLAWVDGKWQDFDVTPASWLVAETSRASWLESLSDVGSRVWFEFSKLRWGQTAWRKYAFWVLVPALVVLLVRMFFGKQWKRLRQERQRKAAAALLPGFDSEFYRIEQALATFGLPRRPDETLSDWLVRVQTHPTLAVIQEPLHVILRLHYRYRFDPLGLGKEEREELRAGVTVCLARLRAGVG